MPTARSAIISTLSAGGKLGTGADSWFQNIISRYGVATVQAAGCDIVGSGEVIAWLIHS